MEDKVKQSEDEKRRHDGVRLFNFNLVQELKKGEFSTVLLVEGEQDGLCVGSHEEDIGH